MQIPEQGLANNTPSSVRDLSLNRTSISWEELASVCTGLFQYILTLELALNSLSNLPSCCLISSSLTHLNLSHNEITEFDLFSAFPKLETLVLASNRISNIPIGMGSKLQHLDLSHNPILDLSEFKNLQSHALLSALQYSRECSTEEQLRLRLDLIRILPQLQTINRTTVTASERVDSQISSETTRPSNNISSKLITINILYGELCTVKKLMKTQNVQQLRGVVARLTKSDVRSLGELEYCGIDGRTEKLHDNLAQLTYYNVEDGGMIRILPLNNGAS